MYFKFSPFYWRSHLYRQSIWADSLDDGTAPYGDQYLLKFLSRHLLSASLAYCSGTGWCVSSYMLLNNSHSSLQEKIVPPASRMMLNRMPLALVFVGAHLI